MQDFKSVKVWQKAHPTVLEIYRMAGRYPAPERYGLTSQTLRSAVSICANIAEGCGRRGDRDFAHYLQMALGSANETQYLLLLARDLKYLPQEDHLRLSRQIEEVRRMLIAYLQRLRASGF